jgi:hypothetical protein
MLTADQLDALTDSISAIYEEYQQSVINDIARRLGKLKFDSAAWQVQRLTESGLTYQNALKELAKVTNKSEKELREVFEKAGVQAMEFDDAIYKAAGLDPLPLNLSPAMARVLSAGLAKTKNVMRNLTLTTAMSAQQSFISAADLAYMQVANGAMSYDQAIRAAVKKLANEGVSVIHYASGRKDHLDVAMRRTVLTGVSQTTGQMQMTRADEMGVDLVQVSAHIGARPSHAAWQGKIFSLSGKHAKYPDLAASTGYGTAGGLMGANCRHSFYPFFEGISANHYKAAELKRYANESVTYNGKKMGVYEATQVQRGIERDIRRWKREAEALQVIGDDNSGELAKVKEYQSKMRDFISQMNNQGKPFKWNRQGVREQVVTSNRPKLQDIKNLAANKVISIGNANQKIVSRWSDDIEGNLEVVLTGKQRAHYIGRHKEMGEFEKFLFDVIVAPDEVHKNKADKMMAIFYKQQDKYHYLRVAVLMQKTKGDLRHSILSYRIAGLDEIVLGRKQGRMVWEK